MGCREDRPAQDLQHDELHRDQDQALGDPGGQQRHIGRAVSDGNPEGLYEQAQDQLINRHGADDPLGRKAVVEEETEHCAGEKRRQRKAREIGPRREEKHPENIADCSHKTGCQRAVQHACERQRNESKANSHIPHVEGEKSLQHNVERDEEGEDDEFLRRHFFGVAFSEHRKTPFT